MTKRGGTTPRLLTSSRNPFSELGCATAGAMSASPLTLQSKKPYLAPSSGPAAFSKPLHVLPQFELARIRRHFGHALEPCGRALPAGPRAQQARGFQSALLPNGRKAA